MILYLLLNEGDGDDGMLVREVGCGDRAGGGLDCCLIGAGVRCPVSEERGEAE